MTSPETSAFFNVLATSATGTATDRREDNPPNKCLAGAGQSFGYVEAHQNQPTSET
jgi:hypothetical protein